MGKRNAGGLACQRQRRGGNDCFLCFDWCEVCLTVFCFQAVAHAVVSVALQERRFTLVLLANPLLDARLANSPLREEWNEAKKKK